MKAESSCKSAIQNALDRKNFAIAHLYNEERTMDMHIHDCYELYYSISGGKQFLIDNSFYDIHPGDLFVINQFESHYLSKIDQMVHERIVLSIHPDLVKSLSTDGTDLSTCFTQRNGTYSHRLSLNKEQQSRFMYFINKITTAGGFGADVVERVAFMEMLVLINSLFLAGALQDQSPAAAADEIPGTYNRQVDEILTYINLNIREEISIAKISEHFFLSESYVCRIFKSATGTTINKYINARRISIAKSLLSGSASVTQVCEDCGFNDYSNFLKAFTKAVGISPKKYAHLSNS